MAQNTNTLINSDERLQTKDETVLIFDEKILYFSKNKS